MPQAIEIASHKMEVIIRNVSYTMPPPISRDQKLRRTKDTISI